MRSETGPPRKAMGDPFKKVQPGDDQEIPAETFNTFIDAALDFKARTRGLGQKATPQVPQRTIIPVKNMTGAQRNRFDVAAVDQPIFDLGSAAGKQRPAAVGVKPDPASQLGRIAVFLEPADVGAIARCCVSGVTVARVTFHEKWHRWADFKKDECQSLESRAEPGGAYILWSPGSTGTQMCLVRLSNPPPVHFPAKITSATSIPGSQGRYKYTFAEVEKKAKEHDGWQVKDDGRSGTAFNLVETVNDPQCVPAKVGETVRMDEVHFTGESGEEETEYWFQYEEYDQDAPSDGSSASPGSDGGPPPPGGYVDIVTCDIHNRCGQYFVFKQKRISYDARGNITSITDISPSVVPIYECQSSGGPPPPPDYSSGDSSDFIGQSSGGPPSEVWYIWHRGAAGEGEWWISKTIGDESDGYCWRKFDGGDTTPPVEGQYGTGPFTSGVATVSDAGGMDLNVSGTLNPDATGFYSFQGFDHLYNGLGTWKRTGGLP